MKNPIVLAAATLFAFSFTIARADTAFEPRTVTVHFAELDVDSARGAAVLYRRIRAAAEDVCRDLDPQRVLERIPRYSACLHDAVGGAVARLNRPLLTAQAVAHGTLPADVPPPAALAKVVLNAGR